MKKIVMLIRRKMCIILCMSIVCASIFSLSGCARSPGTDSSELYACMMGYFEDLYRVHETFHQAVLDEFHASAEKLAACVEAHDDYFTDYPDAKAACLLMAQIPDVLEQNLEPSEEDTYDASQLPALWRSCIFGLWYYVYPGVYCASRAEKSCSDAALLQWIAEDGDGSWSPCHWWLDAFLSGALGHVQWPEPVAWQPD